MVLKSKDFTNFDPTLVTLRMDIEDLLQEMDRDQLMTVLGYCEEVVE